MSELRTSLTQIPEGILNECKSRYTHVIDELGTKIDENTTSYRVGYQDQVIENDTVTLLDSDFITTKIVNGTTAMTYMIRANIEEDKNTSTATCRIRQVLESGRVIIKRSEK